MATMGLLDPAAPVNRGGEEVEGEGMTTGVGLTTGVDAGGAGGAEL
jgi:predicted amidohydrolase